MSQIKVTERFMRRITEAANSTRELLLQEALEGFGDIPILRVL